MNKRWYHKMYFLEKVIKDFIKNFKVIWRNLMGDSDEDWLSSLGGDNMSESKF